MRPRDYLGASLALLFPVLLLACEMQPAEILDSPRVLAIRAVPAGFSPEDEVRLDALTFAVESPLTWSACPVLWAPTDPPSCPVGEAIALGTGASITFTAPAGVGSLWVQAFAPEALPAVRLLKADPTITNPALLGLLVDGDPDHDGAVSAAREIALAPRFAGGVDADSLITSWYVSAGILEPPRTIGDAAATLTLEDAAGPVTVIAVTRNTDGGVAWAEVELEVTP